MCTFNHTSLLIVCFCVEHMEHVFNTPFCNQFRPATFFDIWKCDLLRLICKVHLNKLLYTNLYRCSIDTIGNYWFELRIRMYKYNPKNGAEIKVEKACRIRNWKLVEKAVSLCICCKLVSHCTASASIFLYAVLSTLHASITFETMLSNVFIWAVDEGTIVWGVICPPRHGDIILVHWMFALWGLAF